MIGGKSTSLHYGTVSTPSKQEVVEGRFGAESPGMSLAGQYGGMQTTVEEVGPVGGRGLAMLAAMTGFLAWVVFRRSRWLPGPVWGLSREARQGMERNAIRWSGDFLRSMGAVETAPRAELEAMLAHRVAKAVLQRLQAAATEIRVMIIGGVIHLEGTVTNAEARLEAERVARETSGARVIADDLRVR